MFSKLAFSRGVIAVMATVAFGASAPFAFAATVASQVHYTANADGSFVRSTEPQNLPAGTGTVSQTSNPNGSVTLNINSATASSTNPSGYADAGFYTTPMRLGNVKSVSITGSDSFGVNIWLDTNTNGEFFTWTGDVYSGFGGDQQLSDGPVPQNGTLLIDDSSNFHSYSGDYNPSHTLAQLKNGEVSGITSDTKVSFWVGTTTMNGGTHSATITAFNVVPSPVVNTTTGNGYSTIQAAVNAANPGDTLNVAAGTYTEQILVNKQLTINGSNVGISAGAVAGARADEAVVDGGFYIQTAADGTVIDGFTVQGGYADGGHNNGFTVELSGTPGITIQNNIIKDVTPSVQSNGIEAGYNANNLIIKNNNINNNWRGIYLNPASDGKITGNIINANNVSGVGIGSSGQSNLTVSGNTISNQTVEGWGSDTVGANVVAHNNSFSGNTAGLDWYAGTANTIDATNNWWGNASGPGFVGPGTGDMVSVNVNFEPWYIDAARTVLNTDAPIISPDGSVFHGSQDVTINVVADTQIHYTLDGSTPACDSIILYTDTLTLSNSTELKAIRCVGTTAISAIATATFSPAAGGGSDNNGGGNNGGGSIAAIPATPATPAVPTVSPATPATPATPAQGRGQVLGAAMFNFTKALAIGSRGAEVTALQQFLSDNKFFSETPTGYFGQLTKKAVIAFQKARSIAQVGNVGPLTRAELNKGTIAVTPETHSSSKITADQVSSILGLLKSFGADQSVIDSTRLSLGL